ncbi:MAG: neutral/alkaline non-lysosomal ceramidase N-terminal domain-containing protein [Labilithrix sp.]|nr:neutral/alkaline non-lysosomal ceramidase N-terminal domain-containing protein [Labilithrix sp.]MCW5809435.1 neutral/alkaline non-lysosomal ceramidase N-terminal domain-containing protein [Labilithrix sp.]
MGRADITVYERGMCMFGWGQPENVALGVALPLYARALVVECPNTRRRVGYVCADLGFISQHLRQKVLERIAERGVMLDEHDVMITATHTHSGPNGYSTYLFYSVTGPGFAPRVVDGLARGIVRALERAIATLAPARLTLHTTSVPLVETVSFNRSIAAYNLNDDVRPLPPDRSDEAVDRALTLLRVDDASSGRARGFLCWFPVHGTSIHFENTLLHPDNKGVAARDCEERAARVEPRSGSDERDSFVAIFAQESAGDVTPNFRWSPKRRLLVGKHDDDFESAEHAGRVQARHAWDAFREAPSRGVELRGALSGQIRYRDFASIAVDPDFARGREGRATSVACLGLGFAYGTLEGPGPAFALRAVNPVLSKLVAWCRRRRGRDWRSMHGSKVRFFDLGYGARGNVMTSLSTRPPGFQLLPDSRVAYYCRVLDSGRLGDHPWVPQVLPTQILLVGSLAIVGIPAEPTTVSGRRMRSTVASALAPIGVDRVVVNGYANAYAAYVTTEEEYRLQHYEAASTLFGRWTLAAWRTELRRLAGDMVHRRQRSPKFDSLRPALGDEPLRFRDHELLPSV